MKYDYSKENLEKLIPNCHSVSEVFKKMGCKSHSKRMKEKLLKLLGEYKINFSHFNSQFFREKQIKYKRIEKECPNCGKTFFTQEGHPREKKTCSRRCSSKFFFEKRMTPETKKKIQKSINNYYKNNDRQLQKKNCIICSKKFKPQNRKQICCSRKCGNIHSNGSLPLTKEEVISQIKELSKSGDFQKRKAGHKLVGAAVKFFGTWNKAIKECGLNPNKSHYQKTRIESKDGDICDSLSEKIIDDFLFENKIIHECHKKYPNSNFICDWYFPKTNTWVEYFGLNGEDKIYTENTNLKIEMCKNLNLDVIHIYPKDLYQNNNLGKIFKDYI